MHIIQFTHPDFINSQSMPRFARMISDAMIERGYAIECWSAKPITYLLPVPAALKKWLGYIDQFIIFPLQVRLRLRNTPKNTLFVFSDQALGPWVPLVSERPHVIHVHDFLALRSALGEYPQNPTSRTGRAYQWLIRRGFSKGKNFISVSQQTREDLHRFLPAPPEVSEVVYNGLNYPYHPMTTIDCARVFDGCDSSLPLGEFLLHIGGNQWYKNRMGVLEIYAAYANACPNPVPLLMIGPPPTQAMQEITVKLPATAQVRFISGLSNEQVCAAYSSARLLLFPSIAEGFGWPIAEAMACGCPVLTTGRPPMNEVGGDAAFYIPEKPQKVGEIHAWAENAAHQIIAILGQSPDSRNSVRESCLRNAARFDTDKTIASYENIYLKALTARVTP